jgi:hypothetical protein
MTRSDEGTTVQRYITPATASRTDLVRLAIYYCQRFVTSRRIRRVAHHALLFVLRRRFSHSARAESRPDAAITRFREHGYLRLKNMVSDEQCREMHAWLAGRTLLDSRGTGAPFTLDTIPASCRLGDYSLETVVNCPHAMDIANHPDMLRLATDYLGFTPTITGLSMRWTFPGGAAPDVVQSFHRDCELGSFKLLIYLTDVHADTGPHTYIARSHRDRMPMRLRVYSDEEVLRDHGEGVTMLGSSGTTFAIDTRGLHKGAIPVSAPRLMLGVQYSLLPCLLFDYLPAPYTGASILAKYINRLVVA